MYSTCIFCHASLGANTSIEHFPTGRRLAFDGVHGRLWAVCRNCERWNLTPIEERWEALEECEIAFRSTRMRVSTDHVGMARLRDGTDLVRIGEPTRPEMAAWRYGDQFGRRRRRHGAAITTVAVGVAAVYAAGIVAGGVGFAVANLAVGLSSRAWSKRRVLRSDIGGIARTRALAEHQFTRRK
jgi:hypothetical protein